MLKKEHLDGVKFFLDAPTNGNGADAWVLFRASGTEPLLRLYAEAASPELVRKFCTGRDFRQGVITASSRSLHCRRSHAIHSN